MKEDLSGALAELAGLSMRQKRAEHSIANAAAARREEIDGNLAKLRSRALTDAAAAEEYQALVLERGRLDRVLAKPD